MYSTKFSQLLPLYFIRLRLFLFCVVLLFFYFHSRRTYNNLSFFKTCMFPSVYKNKTYREISVHSSHVGVADTHCDINEHVLLLLQPTNWYNYFKLLLVVHRRPAPCAPFLPPVLHRQTETLIYNAPKHRRTLHQRQQYAIYSSFQDKGTRVCVCAYNKQELNI